MELPSGFEPDLVEYDTTVLAANTKEAWSRIGESNA